MLSFENFLTVLLHSYGRVIYEFTEVDLPLFTQFVNLMLCSRDEEPKKIKIHCLFFGESHTATGLESKDFVVEKGINSNDFIRLLEKQFPSLTPLLTHCILAVNLEYTGEHFVHQFNLFLDWNSFVICREELSSGSTRRRRSGRNSTSQWRIIIRRSLRFNGSWASERLRCDHRSEDFTGRFSVQSDCARSWCSFYVLWNHKKQLWSQRSSAIGIWSLQTNGTEGNDEDMFNHSI